MGLDGGRQIIGAMLLGDAGQLPEARLDPFSQRLKCLGKTDRDCLHIGIGQHQMEQQMGEGNAVEGHLEVIHMREVGLGQLAWAMDVFEDDRLLWAVERPPGRHMALKGAELPRRIAVGLLLTKQHKERFSLQRTITPQVLLDPRPIGQKRVGSRLVGARVVQGRGQLGGLEIFPRGWDAHIGAGGGLFDGLPILAFAKHQMHLGIGFHGASF